VPDTLRLIREAREFASVGERGSHLRSAEAEPRGFREDDRHSAVAKPDRFAVYAYAHLPQMFKAQRQLNAEFLPTPETRLDLLGSRSRS